MTRRTEAATDRMPKGMASGRLSPGNGVDIGSNLFFRNRRPR
ncbi:hypothetical protein [Bradyrhizobium sp. 27S5]